MDPPTITDVNPPRLIADSKSEAAFKAEKTEALAAAVLDQSFCVEARFVQSFGVFHLAHASISFVW